MRGEMFGDRLGLLADALDELHAAVLQELSPVLRPLYRFVEWVTHMWPEKRG